MTTISRRVWQCPGCGSKWQIPAEADDPRFCPQCEQASTGIPPEMPITIDQFAPVPKQKRLKTWNCNVIIASALCLAILAMIVFRPNSLRNASKNAKNVVNAVLPAQVVDEEFKLVEKYLKENLDDPKHEVVRWWPVKEKRNSPKKFCRMKYRTKNRFGATQLEDVIFVIDGKQMYEHREFPMNGHWMAYVQMFDE